MPGMSLLIAKHDPVPNRSLRIKDFRSVESLHWHLLCHGIADRWLEPHQLYLLSGTHNSDAIKKVWNEFKNEVRCSRWGNFDLPYMDQEENRRQWKEAREQLKKKYCIKDCQGCYKCSDENDNDTFSRCRSFFEEYQKSFLERIAGWIKETIQNESLSDFYAKNLDTPPSGKVSSRRHIHAIAGPKSLIYAYVMNPEDSGRTGVYLMLFKVESETMEFIRCNMLTVYGIETAGSQRKAAQMILDHAVELGMKDVNFKHYCHKSNWNAIIQDESH